VRSGPPIRCLLCCRRCAQASHTRLSSFRCARRCTSEAGQVEAKSVSGSIATSPWPSGPAAGPGPDRATTWRWACLEPAKRSRRLDLKSQQPQTPPAPSGPSALCSRPPRAWQSWKIRRSPDPGPQFSTLLKVWQSHCRLHFLMNNALPRPTNGRRGTARPFPAPLLCTHAHGQPTFLILGDEHRPSNLSCSAMA